MTRTISRVTNRAIDYGTWLGTPNYTEGRPAKPDMIVLHTMVGTFASANARFQNAAAQVSAHFGVNMDGSVGQWVHPLDTAWHAGNWPVNQRSIGIEHEDGGAYDDPRPDALYTRSARLVRDLCTEFAIPVSHVFAVVPGVTDHRVVTATRCPDALDTERIVREAVEQGVSQTVKGAAQVPVETLRAYIRQRAPQAPFMYVESLYRVASEFGIRPEVMAAQAIHETGAFTYPRCGQTVFNGCAAFNSFAGIKTTDSSAIATFLSVELGNVAQAAHLAWYAFPDHVGPRCSQAYDPRHFGAHKNNVLDVRDLGGKWAPSADYGIQVLGELAKIMAFVPVTEGDVSFDPRGNPADLAFLDARIREIVLGEPALTGSALRRLLEAGGFAATLPPSLSLVAASSIGRMLDDYRERGHGHGLTETPTRGRVLKKRPVRRSR